MSVYSFTVALVDKVTDGAKSASKSIGDLVKGAKEGEEGFKGLGHYVGMVGDVMKSSLSAMKGAGAAISSLAAGDFRSAFSIATEGAGVLVDKLKEISPTLGAASGFALSLVSTFGGLITSGMGMILKFAKYGPKVLTDTDKMLDGLSSHVSMTREQLAPIAKELQASGIRELPELRRQVLAVASAQAMMGEEGRGAYMALTEGIERARESGGALHMSTKQLGKQLATVGLSLDDMSKALGTSTEKMVSQLKAGGLEANKFGDALTNAVIEKGKKPLERFGKGLEGISNRFMQTIGRIFEQVDTRPFLDALGEIVDAFGGTEKSSKGMVDTFNGFFKFAGSAVKWLVLAFLDVAHVILSKVVPAMKSMFGFIGKIIGGITEIFSLLSKDPQKKEAAGDISADFARRLTEREKLTGRKATRSEALALFDKQSQEAITGMGEAGKTLFQKRTGADPSEVFAMARKDFEKGGSYDTKNYLAPDTAGPNAAAAMKDVGLQAGKGLMQGLTESGAGVTAAASDLAGKAKDAVKNTLQVHSPSQVFRDIGRSTAEGFELGLEDRGGHTFETAARMYEAKGEANDNGAAWGGARGRGGDINVTMNVQIDGAGKDALEITEEMVATVFERLALAEGL